jgi:hypothetical protein
MTATKASPILSWGYRLDSTWSFMTITSANQPLMSLPTTEDTNKSAQPSEQTVDVAATAIQNQSVELKESTVELLHQTVNNALALFRDLIFICKQRAFLLFLIFTAYCSWCLLCKTGAGISNTLFQSSEHTTTDTDFRKTYTEKLTSYANTLDASAAEKQRLRDQALEVRIRAISQFEMTKYFYRQFFVAISMSAMWAVVSAVTLFSMSKLGWDNCKSKPLVAVFVVSSGVTVFFSSSIFIFQLESNIAENKKLYLAYSALEDRVLSYMASGQFRLATPISTELATTTSTSSQSLGFVKEPEAVISYIDGELAAINNIAIGFDANKIPNYQDLQKLSNDASPQQP